MSLVPIPKELSNQSKLTRSAAMVSLTCPTCQGSFERYACHAKRATTSYCGWACKVEGQKRQVAQSCVYCSTIFSVRASNADKIKTCSKRCSRLRRTKQFDDLRMRKEVLEIAQAASQAATHCARCQHEFQLADMKIVKGLTYHLNEDLVTVFVEGSPEVTCQPCHLISVHEQGGEANRQRLEKLKSR